MFGFFARAVGKALSSSSTARKAGAKQVRQGKKATVSVHAFSTAGQKTKKK